MTVKQSGKTRGESDCKAEREISTRKRLKAKVPVIILNICFIRNFSRIYCVFIKALFAKLTKMNMEINENEYVIFEVREVNENGQIYSARKIYLDMFYAYPPR